MVWIAIILVTRIMTELSHFFPNKICTQILGNKKLILKYIDAWGWCTGMTQRDGMGREQGSGWGTRVYLWRIHVDIWQNQYNIVKLKIK